MPSYRCKWLYTCCVCTDAHSMQHQPTCYYTLSCANNVLIELALPSFLHSHRIASFRFVSISLSLSLSRPYLFCLLLRPSRCLDMILPSLCFALSTRLDIATAPTMFIERRLCSSVTFGAWKRRLHIDRTCGCVEHGLRICLFHNKYLILHDLTNNGWANQPLYY